MSTALKQPPRKMSVEEYFAFSEQSDIRYEYDKGHVSAMAGGSPNHSLVKRRLCTLLDNAIDGRCLVFDSDMRIQASDAQYYYPDASVICGEPDYFEKHSLRNPQVIFEVLSPSTERKDRLVKLKAYLAIPSVESVVFVRSDTHHVEIFTRGQSQGEGSAMSYRSASGPDEKAAIPSLDVSLPLAELYRDATDLLTLAEIEAEGKEEPPSSD